MARRPVSNARSGASPRDGASALRYERSGRGAPIVLLHPIAMRLEFWEPVAKRLSRAHDVVSVDLRGFGLNARDTEPFSIDDLARDVVRLADDLHLGPALFVGCSLGGMVAQGVALIAPEEAAGIVAADTTHRTTPEGAEMMRQRARRAREDMAAAVASDIERWFSPGFRAGRPEAVEQVRRWALANDPETVANGWLAIAGLDYTDALARLDCPALVMTGSLDPASPPAAARKTQEAIPGAQFQKIADAGHFAPVEQPQAFAEAVVAFARQPAVVARLRDGAPPR
ncbi:MAG TPA: alpha/beta fold hydrolase [Rhizobiaceae bacterium]|jgi:3-oxoadipate enol-lactonase|nr:alpha/beta fold hydrolase [Rhizobiaceae bacterium]